MILKLNKQDVIIRKAKEEDLIKLCESRWLFKTDECKDIDEDFIKECYEFLKEGCLNGTWTHWIAEYNEELISNVSIQVISKFPKPKKLNGRIGYITNFYTRPKFRGNGVGRKLLRKVKLWAKEEKVECLFVWPSAKSIGLYESEGFDDNNDILEIEF